MGYYVGPAPGGNLRTWRHEAARLRILLGHPDLPVYMRDAAQRQLDDLKRLIEMACENTNKQTPRPPFHPESQQEPRRIRKVVIVYEGDERTITHTRYIADEETHTGPTTRLEKTCAHCGDALPLGALFCIECGRGV